MKFTIDTKIPSFGTENFPGNVYDILKTNISSTCNLTNMQKFVLLRSVYSTLKCHKWRMPKYIQNQIDREIEGVLLLIKSLNFQTTEET